MKKLIVFVLVLFVLIFVDIDFKYNIDINVEIKSSGSANVTEVWDVQSIGGTDWCKPLDGLDLGGYTISDFYVYMDGEPLQYVNNWGVDTIFGTKGLYGYRRWINDLDLCFTTGDMKRHTFTLKYKVTNYVFNTNEKQVFYKKLINNSSFEKFSINIKSDYYDFFDDMEIYGYGFDGNIDISNGVISITGSDETPFSYVSILAVLPKNTFNTSNKVYGFDNVYSYLKHANNDYNQYLKYKNLFDNRWLIIILCISLIVLFFVSVKYIRKKIKILNGYGYKNNKKINYEDIELFRDIPFNKDIYYAYTLIKINRIGYDDCNILSAIILKWFNEKKININHNKKVSFIDLTMNSKFEDEIEYRLFNMMYEASNNGILEMNEFHDFAKRYSAKFLSLFSLIEENVVNSLKLDMHIYHRITKDECRCKYVMDDKVYNDSIKLYGLKKYLEEFSMMDTKEVMDIKLWNEYLMFACLFGIADKVSLQLKHMHPDIKEIDDLDLL